ncbi:MAG TPA: hypothetical protein PLG75_04480 [Methanoculleus sp.]|nr:hypothetical protein [Methanoculleus sp.]
MERIPPEPRVSKPVAAVHGTNDYGATGWRGPCPLRGETHRYLFRVYGFDRPLELAPGADRVAFGRAMSDTIRQYGEAVAAYGRTAEVAPSRC